MRAKHLRMISSGSEESDGGGGGWVLYFLGGSSALELDIVAQVSTQNVPCFALRT
ncbi:hypothetical protein DY000_02011996 [Brassica cretica]|uniref:Uncharacterized protein n=1 Tax=Brassica cretica TaxID=69181 RepID=A0ABQ7CY44_BRACR|nr:hypothetical protein DY000_02011996 [Brassica cretica]